MTGPSAEEGHIKRLLDDRVEFKLYSAKQHLNRLKAIDNAYGGIAKYNARIEVENRSRLIFIASYRRCGIVAFSNKR